MSITGYTRASSEKVWASWASAHAINAQTSLVSGAVGSMSSGNKKIPYTILDVIPGKSFSVSWKALFVRLVFSHEVLKTSTGAEIRYDFRLIGPFAWMVRWWISPKIRANLSLVLKAFIKNIEQ